MTEPRPDPGPRSRARKATPKRKPPVADRDMDIAPALAHWPYESGSISVRRINGIDGREKLQLRLDLGLLQMELTGRPDGRRPHGVGSLLEYYERRLIRQNRERSSAPPFSLDADACRALRNEAAMYDQRYLALFVLGDFLGVLNDTARNLRVIDLCAQYAADDHDRLVLEQYRPYIIMMNTRAAASIQFYSKQYHIALEMITAGIEKIRAFFIKFGQDDAIARSSEIALLKRFTRDIRRKLPVDPMDRLRQKLELAIQRENYEEAAKLRDQITTRQSKKTKSRP